MCKYCEKIGDFKNDRTVTGLSRLAQREIIKDGKKAEFSVVMGRSKYINIIDGCMIESDNENFVSFIKIRQWDETVESGRINRTLKNRLAFEIKYCPMCGEAL